MYVGIFQRLIKRVRHQQDGVSLSLIAWAVMNWLMLFGIAIVDNSLKVTRYTLLVAFSPAIAEVAARPASWKRSIGNVANAA